MSGDIREKPTFRFALRPDLVNEKQFLPKRAEPSATGYDVRAAFIDKKPLVLQPGNYFKIPLGFRGYCPAGWYYQLHPRSSSFVKKHMHSLIGIIDETYPDETLFAGQYVPAKSENLTIKWGDPIAQIIPMKRCDEVSILEWSNNELDTAITARGAERIGGIGSTHK